MDRDLEEVPGAVGVAGLRRQGLRFLGPARALAALSQVLADDETFVAVADVDWTRFAPVYGAARSWRLLQELAEVRALASPAAAGDLGLAGRLAGLGAAERDQMVLDLVREQRRRCSGMPRPGRFRLAAHSVTWDSTR